MLLGSKVAVFHQDGLPFIVEINGADFVVANVSNFVCFDLATINGDPFFTEVGRFYFAPLGVFDIENGAVDGGSRTW